MYSICLNKKQDVCKLSLFLVYFICIKIIRACREIMKRPSL